MAIAFSSAGRRVELINAFRQDADRLGVRLRVLALDARADLSAACQVADEALAVPRCTDSDYIPRLLSICRDRGIRLLIPTIDPELGPLSVHQHRFAAIGTRVVVPPANVVQITGDKLLTASRLSAAGVPTPKTLLLRDYLASPEAIPAPVIAKPRSGSSSVGIVRPRAPTDLAHLDPTTYIVQECWSGVEYTVNVYFDASGSLVAAVPHERIEVRSGEVSKGRTGHQPELQACAERIGHALPGVTGPLCFQAIVSPSGRFVVFEINARFGGGYPLAHHAGARFSQWLLEESLSIPSSASSAWRPNVVMLRYDAAVFRYE